MEFTEFYQAYLAEEKARNITRRRHPENEELVILDYTERCVFTKNWNPITEMCRDLIVNEATGEIVAKSFSKFYSQHQRPYFNSEYLKTTHPDASAEFLEKLDGIQGVSYKMNGEIRFAAEGRFTSKSALLAEKLWKRSYSQVEELVPDELTLTVEIIHPELRVVVPYDFEDLVLVGAFNRNTQHDYTYAELQQLALLLGMKIPASYDISFEEACEIAEDADYTSEGFVVRYGNDKRIKVKAKRYLHVFRLTHLTSEKQWTKAWMNGEIDTYIESLPQEFQQRFIDLKTSLLSDYDKILKDIQLLYVKAARQTKKEFALWVMEHTSTHQHLLFKMFDGNLSDQDIKLAVYHNKQSSAE